MYGVLTFLRIVYIYLRNIDITIYLRKIIYIIYLRNTWIISRREGEGGESPPGTYPRHTGIRTAKEGVVALGKVFMREKKVDCGQYREADIIPGQKRQIRRQRGRGGSVRR